MTRPAVLNSLELSFFMDRVRIIAFLLSLTAKLTPGSSPLFESIRGANHL